MARRAARRRASRRRSRTRRRPGWAVAAVGLLLAGACAAAAIAILVHIARPPEAGPFRFPTPAPLAPAR